MTYSAQEARERFSDLLEKARSGERIVIVEDGREVAEILGLPDASSMEERYQKLVEEGVIIPASGPRKKLAPIVNDPGALARFLKSRD